MNDIDLLRVELDTLWLKDDRGRIVRDGGTYGRPAPHFVIATARDGYTHAIGHRVPDDVAKKLVAALAHSAPPTPIDAPPPALDRCRTLLEAPLGPIDVSSGLGYSIPGPIHFSADVEVRRSDAMSHEDLRAKSPASANWASDEWSALLGGALGPWAMALRDDRVVSICHSARLTEHGAEAGVWTNADYRRRGYAAAVTAAWTELIAPAGRHLFYSTSTDNIASQRVAAKLNLSLIGCLWILSSPPSPDARPLPT